MLEEIINTKQTEDIINIIKSFDQNNSIISNTIYAINTETEHKYSSEAYFLQSYICKEILTNRTFISTLEIEAKRFVILSVVIFISKEIL